MKRALLAAALATALAAQAATFSVTMHDEPETYRTFVDESDALPNQLDWMRGAYGHSTGNGLIGFAFDLTGEFFAVFYRPVYFDGQYAGWNSERVDVTSTFMALAAAGDFWFSTVERDYFVDVQGMQSSQPAVSLIPEPSTWAALIAGLMLFGYFFRWRMTAKEIT